MDNMDKITFEEKGEVEYNTLLDLLFQIILKGEYTNEEKHNAT